MKKYEKNSIIIYSGILIFLSLVGLILWWVYACADTRKLIEALITGVPIVIVTLFLGLSSEKNAATIEQIERQNLFLRMEEKYLQELEAWAQ